MCPARLRVIRICRRAMAAGPADYSSGAAPERPIAKGLASPGLLAHV